MDLNPGDKVKIIKPNNRNDGPGWGGPMDRFHGTIQTVKDVLSSGEIFIENDPNEFLFASEWCEKV